jgi:hypothetical protein
MSTFSIGNIDLKRRIIGKGRSQCGSMKTIFDILRSIILGHLDKCWLEIVGIEQF